MSNRKSARGWTPAVDPAQVMAIQLVAVDMVEAHYAGDAQRFLELVTGSGYHAGDLIIAATDVTVRLLGNFADTVAVLDQIREHVLATGGRDW